MLLKTIFSLCRAIVIIICSAFAPSLALSQDINYDTVVFVRESHSADSNRWAQLHFRVEGFTVNGECLFEACNIAFTLDSSLDYPSRSDLGLRRYTNWLGGGLIIGNLTMRNDQAFLGTQRNPPSFYNELRALSAAEKVAISWVLLHSNELIGLALSEWGGSSEWRNLWARKANDFERRVLENADVLAPQLNEIAARANSENDLANIIQPALADMGLYSAEIDGLNGPATERAIREFQRQNFRVATGFIDDTELEILSEHLAGRMPGTVVSAPRETYTLRDAVEDAVAAQTELRSANARIQSLEAELAQAQLERDEFELRLVRSLESLGSARQTIERRSQRITELVMERDGLAAQLSTSRAENEVLNQRVMDLEVFARQNSSEASELEAALNQLSAAQDVISELQEVVLRSRQIYSVRGRDCICDARARRSQSQSQSQSQ